MYLPRNYHNRNFEEDVEDTPSPPKWVGPLRNERKSLYELSTKKTRGGDCKPIAKIVPFRNMRDYAEYLDTPPRKRAKFRQRYVYLVTHDKPISNAKLSLDEKQIGDGTVVPLMIKQEDEYPNRVFIAGGTLTGKSLMASVIANDYNGQHKKNRVILVSAVDDTRNYNDTRIKNLIPIRIDETIIDDPIGLGELHDSCAIFDDIEAHEDRDIVSEMENLRDRCIKAGRHEKTDCIITNQSLLGSQKTQHALRNCFQVVAYPSSAGKHQLTNFLRTYMSFDKDQIKRIMDVPSRYVLINRTMPNYVLSEHEVFLP